MYYNLLFIYTRFVCVYVCVHTYTHTKGSVGVGMVTHIWNPAIFWRLKKEGGKFGTNLGS